MYRPGSARSSACSPRKTEEDGQFRATAGIQPQSSSETGRHAATISLTCLMVPVGMDDSFCRVEDIYGFLALEIVVSAAPAAETAPHFADRITTIDANLISEFAQSTYDSRR